MHRSSTRSSAPRAIVAQRARDMRKSLTPSEQRLWLRLEYPRPFVAQRSMTARGPRAGPGLSSAASWNTNEPTGFGFREASTSCAATRPSLERSHTHHGFGALRVSVPANIVERCARRSTRD